MMEIVRMPVAEFQARDELPELLAEYAEESALAEYAGSAGPQWATYLELERLGMLHLLVALAGDRVIGFASVLVSVLPHFGVPVASTESYFVAKAWRNTGAGLGLLAEVKRVAAEANACGLLVSAPEGSRLAQVLERTDMRASHRVFFKPLQPAALPAMSDGDVDKVEQLERSMARLPQANIPTQHLLHAGVYYRTIKLEPDMAIVGVRIKVPTALVLNGDASVFVGGEEGARRYTGHHVLAGQPGRKQAFVAHAETWLTMSFKTEARTVAEAEAEFTDEAEHLGSRRDDAVNLIETTETLEIAA